MTNSLHQAHLIIGIVVQSISWWFDHDEPEPDAMAEAILFLLKQGNVDSLHNPCVFLDSRSE